MPATVNEDETYLRFHAAPPAENFMAFTVTTLDKTPYTVEYGVVENSTFRGLGSQSVANGTAYQGAFLHGQSTGVYTEARLEQIMLRVSG